ncbi:MAG TPA: alcohol dehydrogenase catalytic domain-containing protein [Candidatus Binataceae bacterium]|nr:alcohol dehydrogenase catalytic domain-containing protein [Candidatus Binataceae bacterium]
MRELTFVGPGSVEWRDVPAPVIDGPNQALVRPIAVATCDLDVLLLRGKASMFGNNFAFGHECVAQVVEVSKGAGPFRPGDIVVPSFQITCGTCGRCRRALTGNCEAVRGTAMYGIGTLGGNYGGALSDLMKIPYASAMLVALPNNLAPADVASIGDNVADAWRTVAPALRGNPEARVLIVGGGSIGLYATQIALALGASTVDYVDSQPARLNLAEELGAHVYGSFPPKGIGRFPITVATTGELEGLTFAIRSTEPGGVCTSVGIHSGNATPMPLFDMYITGMTFVTGRGHARTVLPELLELASTGRITPEKITNKVVPWDDAVDALSDPPDKLVLAREQIET